VLVCILKRESTKLRGLFTSFYDFKVGVNMDYISRVCLFFAAAPLLAYALVVRRQFISLQVRFVEVVLCSF
jgi:hypothetical protein